MLWLLAVLSVVTISWGIAHRLKAGSESFTESEKTIRQPSKDVRSGVAGPSRHSVNEHWKTAEWLAQRTRCAPRRPPSAKQKRGGFGSNAST